MLPGISVLLEFDILFPHETGKIDRLIEGISSKLFIEVGSTFLCKTLLDNSQITLDHIFSEDNQKISNGIKRKINHAYGIEYSRLNLGFPITYLKLIQIGSENLNEYETTLSRKQVEFRVFKIILLLNSQFTKSQKLCFEYIYNNYPIEYQLPVLLFSGHFSTADLLNYNKEREFICQTVKSLCLFNFLNENIQYSPHLKEFLKQYNKKTVNEYLGVIFGIIKDITSKPKDGYFEYVLKDNETELELKTKDLDSLSISTNNFEEDLDFKIIRKSPLVKLEKNRYRVTHPLFLMDKMFKGIFFDLFAINNTFTEGKINSFRSTFTSDFSEKYLFRIILDKLFLNMEIRYSDSDIGRPGAPDYYVRKDNIILLFENKDILISASIKESSNFIPLEEELKKKLLKDGRHEVGLNQIANTVLKAIRKENEFDRDYDERGLIIYPILILNDGSFDTLGLNFMLEYWFKTCLIEKGINETEMQLVRPLSVLNIDTLITSIEYVKNENYFFWELLEIYHNKSFRNTNYTVIKRFYPASKIIFDYLASNHKENLSPMDLIKELSSKLGIPD